jgi:site-specific DNA-adenine methylase
MKQNHFYISYLGNKRKECKELYDRMDFKDVKTFIEPFCGTCAVSFYVWQRQPHLKFILNDENQFLKELYELSKDDEKITQFNEQFESIANTLDKETYKIFIKGDELIQWFVKHKIYNIQPGMFPLPSKPFKKTLDLKNSPIYDFFKNADIDFLNMDGVTLLNDFKNNSDCIIFLDPPYINTCNTHYNYHNSEEKINIYQYLFYNNINAYNCKLFCIFEQNWIIKYLFKDNIIFEYDKKYEVSSKKKTKHLIISNNK